MATAVIPPHAQLSEAAEYRNLMYSSAMPRLQRLAWRALHVLGKKNDEIVIVCIQVDSCWRDLANHLMPGYDWDTIRATGADPVAQGTVTWAVCKFVAEQFPNIADVILEVPPEGKVKVIVLSEGGCTVYELEPKDL